MTTEEYLATRGFTELYEPPNRWKSGGSRSALAATKNRPLTGAKLALRAIAFPPPMLHRSAHPAVQLRSAAARYSGHGHVGAWRRAPNPLTPAPTWPASATPLASGPQADEPAAIKPMPTDTPLSRLEAILFLAREPLPSRKLSQYANLADGTQARTLVRQLNEQYDAAGRAFRVEQVAGGYQLLTRSKLAPWLRRLAHVPAEMRLSPPALETLAVIAYRQPVPRADVEAIRGVNCGEILRQLMDRDLVRIDGRSEELGRPYLYATTKRFLELFGLNQIGELPNGEELRGRALPAGPLVLPQPPEATIAAERQQESEELTDHWTSEDVTSEDLTSEVLTSEDEKHEINF